MEPSAVTIVKLIERRSKSSYQLDEQALKDILTQPKIKDKKVIVVSVVGAFRKGKSFFLNFMVLYLNWLTSNSQRSYKKDEWFTEDTELNCFPWRGGIDRHTQGITMWSAPFIIKNKSGIEYAVLLMDTQGTFDDSTTINECATIFALSTMISSFQIYNISQAIQEDYLQHLRLFIEYGTLATKETNNKPFQTLLFLIRDWQNSDEHVYGYEGGATYLKHVLQESDQQKEELLELRRKIRLSFDKLACFLLPHPGLEVSNNRVAKKVGKLEADFKNYIRLLISSIFDPVNLVPKTVNGQEITCEQLMHLFKAYMGVFNGNKIPKPMSILQATGEANNSMAVAKAKLAYETEMKMVVDLNIMNLNFLRNGHEEAKITAFKEFNKAPKMGGKELSKKYEEALSNELQIRYFELERNMRDKIETENNRRKLIREQREKEEKQRRDMEELENKKREDERLQLIEKLRQKKIAESIEYQKRKTAEEQEELERRLQQQRQRAKEESERQQREMRYALNKLEEEFREMKEKERRMEQNYQRQREQAAREERERRERENRASPRRDDNCSIL